MPLKKISSSQLDTAAAANIISQLKTTLTQLAALKQNLTPEERQEYGSINERNKLILNKTNDFHLTQPELQSPDVDWAQFDASFATRTNLANIEALCSSILESCSDARILHDYDLYQLVLSDYSYTKYKAESTNDGGGYTTKMQELKQFFPGTGGSGPKVSDSAPADPNLPTT